MTDEQESQEIQETWAQLHTLTQDWVVLTHLALKKSQDLFPWRSFIRKVLADREAIQLQIDQLIGDWND